VSAKAATWTSSAKHSATGKHTTTTKHTTTIKRSTATSTVTTKTTVTTTVTTVAKPAAHAKPRSFAIGDVLPVCAFEAVAQSLRLVGQRVHEDEVGQVWTLAGARQEGVTIGEALAATARSGLAGVRVHSPLDEQVFADLSDDLAELQLGERIGEHLFRGDAAQLQALGGLVGDRPSVHGLILGVDRPGPHAVLATPDGWWSWGGLWSPWPCRIDEAWAVSWS